MRMTTLLDMVSIHIPVLAGELIELLDPRPGAVAVDCTIGGGGHARLVADRIGPAGTLIGIDRDPIAEERFAELAAEVPCATRFIRADFASGLEQLREEGVAADVVNEWDERRLARLLREYGDERYAGRIARAIVRDRAHAPIETTHALVETIKSAIPAPAQFAGGHPAKRTFQAIRIAVNEELEQLDRALPLAW